MTLLETLAALVAFLFIAVGVVAALGGLVLVWAGWTHDTQSRDQ